jgi:hypothetical protein
VTPPFSFYPLESAAAGFVCGIGKFFFANNALSRAVVQLYLGAARRLPLPFPKK